MAIHKLGIVGAGTMGSGIAIASALHGLDVRLVDAQPQALARAQEAARTFYARAVERGRMDAAAAEAAAQRIVGVDDVEDLADRDLVIEAVFEDFDLKARLFRTLSDIVPATCLVATNTSCLRVSDLQEHMVHPERFLGLHYFSPAQINPIVEVVRGARTDEPSYAAALAFCRATGKDPLPCKDQYGFAINRFFCPYTNEAARCLDEGLGTTGEIDAVARTALGVAAGPFLVMNLIKPRVNLHAIRNLGPLGAFYAPAASMAATGDADGKWAIQEPDGVPAERAKAIADRLMLGCFLPTLQALDEGVAEPKVIDHGAREALKMAKAPCATMDELGEAEVRRILAPALPRYAVAMPASIARVGRLTS